MIVCYVIDQEDDREGKVISEMTLEFVKTIDEDVGEEILSILPPKSLKRFQCVSKRWYALITTPRFVAKHLSNSMRNDLSTSVLMKRRVHKDTNSDKTQELFSFLHFRNDEDNDVDGVHDEHSFLSSIQEFHIPFSTGVKTRAESLIIIGHSNGIICLAQAASGEVIICNPAIHEYKLLPPSPHLPDSDWPCSPLFRFRDGLGFGHDPNFNEYKVINIGFPAPELSTPDGFNIYNPPKAAVYTLGTDSWREISTDSLETETTILWPEQFQMHFKDMCFWRGQEQHKELDVLDDDEEPFIREVIIMFDTGDELFHNIMLPDEFYYPNYFVPNLLVWKDSVALLGIQICQPSSYGIWVIDEFGGPNGGAWTKHITFELPVEPLIFWKSDEVLLNGPNDTDYRGLIFSYNLGTKKL
ncbi:putative F-box domain-containing protein [Rosa chinensis]|uniref:Putative F-box domain-containing protein n=1 Tax=Rosa chinensis TaxID=74649 RepID=A0A2P6QSB1_ROSCH|nr:putative F-box domain-containing protein [Rosa chinensis]